MRRALRGLRGRLLVALLLTSAITLGVAAAVTLSPLEHRLRREGEQNLQDTVLEARPRFDGALRRGGAARDSGLLAAAYDLQGRSEARVVVGQYPPAFRIDTDVGALDSRVTLTAVSAILSSNVQSRIDGDELTVAMPFGSDEAPYVVVAQRRLTEVTTAVHQVRNALLAAAGVGLLVAVVLATAISGTLLRRLRRLRNVALRISSEGPDAPAPRDAGRDEVGDLARALARMQHELRLQEAARRSFVATASHELRTPLTMLQGTMELLEEDLRDGGDLGDAQDQVADARRELLRLSALAEELLDLSRLDAAVQLRSEPVELGEVARAVAAEFELRARERDVRLDVRQPAVACWGRGDPDAVARVIRILLDNALRYGPPGEPVRVLARCEGARALAEVADRGPGVPEEERERIFERFHRGRAASGESGFGLGLAIGRELARRMHGDLRIVEGPGARFVLTVPVATPSSPAPSPERGSAAAA
jgi:signal transduction histidine kinase